MKKKSKIIAGVIVGLCLMATGFGVVKATSGSIGSNNPMSKLVILIAQKFNLNETDVQNVVDEYKTQMDTERESQQQTEFTARINKAVTDGKLTQAQADLIVAKMAELKTQEEAMRSMTPEERKTTMKERMDTMKQWMTDNNIPQEFCPCGMGMGMGMKMGMDRGHGGINWEKPTQK